LTYAKICLQKIFNWVPEYVKSDTIADILERSVAHPFIQEVHPTFGSLIISGNITKELLKEVKHSYPEDVLNILDKAISVYNEDRKTKDDIQNFDDN